ncbi:hypothetical protein H6F90_14695 [Trichocoleus sp. FACHB-591]|uniref:WD40 repeat domain-containing protein n=1 Tax=Trichocoleus sp. FACHB-591 TaxID=2692872 RepID=UPI001684BA48|nr:hypothetical protein [Trichocoleus sp. FACHB-591]MBD2096387.1 hypothetical protein [Trichocoleus sp. FACHB-591]
MLAVGTQKDGVEVWDLEAKRLQRFEVKSWYTRFVEFSPNGQLMISQAYDVIKVWHRDTGELLHTLSWEKGVHNRCLTAQISPDGETVIGVDSRSIVQQWNLKTGELLHKLRLNARGSQSAAYSLDGRTLLETYPLGEIKLWNWQTGELLCSMRGHSHHYIASVAFSPNGQFAVTGGNDGTIQVWGLPSESK